EASPVDDEPTPWSRSRPLLQLAAAALLVVSLVVVLNASHKSDLEKVAGKIDVLEERLRTNIELVSKISDNANQAIASSRISEAAQGAPDRVIILADIAPHHLIVRGVFDLKQFGSFELFRRGEGQADDAF